MLRTYSSFLKLRVPKTNISRLSTPISLHLYHHHKYHWEIKFTECLYLFDHVFDWIFWSWLLDLANKSDVFNPGSSCHLWTNSLQRPSNRPTLLTWWRMSTSTFPLFKVSLQYFSPQDGQWLHCLLVSVYVCVTFLILPVNRHRVVRNPNYGWRALRLLSRRSPHFFQPTNQKFKSLADYLDSMVSKLAKELPVRVFVCFT